MPRTVSKKSKRRTRAKVVPITHRRAKLSREEIDARARKYARKYTDKNYKAIAAALGVLVARVRQQARCFEGAGHWFWLDKRTPPRSRPTDLRRQLGQIQDAADRLLAHLGVDAAEAADGPGLPDVFDALALANVDGWQLADN